MTVDLAPYDSLPTDRLGQATLAKAQADVGIAETCPDWGPEIQVFLKTVGVTSGAPWCAAAMQTWIVRAAFDLSVMPPVRPDQPSSAMARGMMQQLKDKGRWLDRRSLTLADVQPGWVVVWDRSTPLRPYGGHVGIVEGTALDKGTFQTIDGNSGPYGSEVARNQRAFADGRLFGFGVLSGPMPGTAVARAPAPLLGRIVAAAAGFAAGVGVTLVVRGGLR